MYPFFIIYKVLLLFWFPHLLAFRHESPGPAGSSCARRWPRTSQARTNDDDSGDDGHEPCDVDHLGDCEPEHLLVFVGVY